MSEEHRHAAIMFTDIAGYTALMGSDEERAFEMLRKNREIHTGFLKKFNGSLIKEMGDGMLISFQLSSEAVRCAVEIQKACKNNNIPLRIGIHDGEVVYDEMDILGDGVNIASRLQASGVEGCILISGTVYSNIRNKTDIRTVFIGEKKFKNVGEPVKVYEVCCDESGSLLKRQMVKGRFVAKHRILLTAISFIILMAVIVAGYFYYHNHDNKIHEPLSRSLRDSNKSIAILPFKNMSDDPSNQYFSDGIMDAVLNNLTRIRELMVISRTTMEQYRNPKKTIPVISRELKVAYVLEGSVQKYGNKVRIIVQLIQGQTDHHLWSEEYDRELTDIFAIQSEISEKIADRLKAELTPEEKQVINKIPTDNLIAYDYFLKAKDLFYSGMNDFANNTFYKAQSLLQRSVELDAKFADGYIWLGLIYFVLNNDVDMQKEQIDSLGYYCEKGLKLNPDLALGYSLRSWYYLLQGKKGKAVEDINRALEIDPNDPLSNLSIGIYYEEENDPEQSLFYLLKGIKLGAKFPMILNICGSWFFDLGDVKRAEDYLAEARKLRGNPNTPSGYQYRTYVMEGNFEKAVDYILSNYDWFSKRGNNIDFVLAENLMALKRFQEARYYFNKGIEKGYMNKPGNLPQFYDLFNGYILWGMGDTADARVAFQNQIKFSRDNIKKRTDYGKQAAYYDLAKVYAFLGDRKNAIGNLEKQLKQGFFYELEYYMMFDPFFESLHEDPEFLEIVRQAQAPKKALREKIYQKLEEENLL